MKQPIRKPTEFAINMHCEVMAILQQEHLTHPHVKQIFQDNPPHIYFVVKRPRISLITETFKIDKNFIEVDYKIQNKENFIIKKLKARNKLKTHNASLICEFPFSEFKIIDNDSKKIISKGSVGTLLNSLHYDIEDKSFLDCEVLYIGQSFGKDGNRLATDRLQSHSTLQLIYSEAIKKNPDSEIWICLASFVQINIMVLNRPSDFSKEDLSLDESNFQKRYNKINIEGINEAQEINFTEAALIRYFQPPYNKEYKDSFPHKNHSSYSECYDLDINSVSFDLDTSETICCQLFSQNVGKSYLHIGQFLLHSPEERKAYFDIF